jgi:hypothetical protein
MARFCLAGSFLLVLLGSAGCTSSEAPKGAAPATRVTGTVTMDGKPLPAGELHFGVPGYAPGVLEIKDGKYEGEAPVGKNEVQLFIYTWGPPVARYGGQRVRSNAAPAKYWGPKTALSATVEAGGTNEFKFDLTSK